MMLQIFIKGPFRTLPDADKRLRSGALTHMMSERSNDGGRERAFLDAYWVVGI